ncbi:cytochrome P450 (plasmid) [Rhodococcus sp. ZPP]|uniref:cytochrome P450 n=1 Tax=Rhodococcus sp. ZPP TaxID=2749906 RepID=UPI001AD866F5|nr:cytochrome P450 [Rhodococcus sp. ZPP]QTJ70250.1 cytochrome P450 [Rhodococcus sp. ZPP]
MSTEPLRRRIDTDFDLNDPEINERWDDVISAMHQGGCPVARSEVGEGYWVLYRHDDVANAVKDWETFSASDGFMVNRPAEMPYFAPGESDPPLHTELRAALEPFLRPRAVKGLEDKIRGHADRLIDTFITQGETDVVDFANALPQAVFSVEVAGMDPADMPYLLEVFSLSGPAEERAENFGRGIAKIDEYLRQRSKEPSRGDLIDALLAFEHEGYEWMDKVGTMCQLTIGGIGTTGFAITGGLHHLATHPVDRQRLVEDPSQLPRAIDEFLRMFMGAPNMARRAMRDVEVGGTKIAAGDRVLMSFGAASRDPEIYERPDEVDLQRKPTRHFAFGGGNHLCIGQHLAKLILRVAYEQFLARIPEFTVPEGFKPEYETANVRHMVSLPIIFEPSNVVGSVDSTEVVS